MVWYSNHHYKNRPWDYRTTCEVLKLIFVYIPGSRTSSRLGCSSSRSWRPTCDEAKSGSRNSGSFIQVLEGGTPLCHRILHPGPAAWKSWFLMVPYFEIMKIIMDSYLGPTSKFDKLKLISFDNRM